MSILVLETWEDFVQHVKNITAGWKPDACVASVPKTDFGKGMMSVWDRADFGCQTPHVGQILHLLVKQIAGEDVSFPKKGRDEFYPKFCAIVPLSNPNSHSYPLGQVCVVNNSDNHYAVRQDAVEADHLPSIGQALRLATVEEIDAFFASVDEAKRDEFMEHF